MKIRIELKSGSNDEAAEVSETTLEEFLANDDGIAADEAARIRSELETTGRSRVVGFVTVYADLFKL